MVLIACRCNREDISYAFGSMRLRLKYLLGLLFTTITGICAQSGIAIVPAHTPVQWQVAEFGITGVPAVSNPFDYDQISVRGTFSGSSGKTTTVDAFWYQNYRTELIGGSETLAAQGTPEWRLRFTPDESGIYQLRIQITTAATNLTTVTTFTSSERPATNSYNGFVRLAANRRNFDVGGRALVLNGANTCWYGSRGTFDYIDWFSAMHRNGENYGRLWMCPWAFGIESEPGTRTHYRLDRAWQLDQVFRIAETNGIFLMLCLEYHGMLQTEPDQFGGNNGWKDNPYNTVNGGPCASPNDFFTNTAARDLYKKRLRYIIARYGASPNLLCWELFNEIDNDYNVLNATSVANWHSAVGTWMHQTDPFQHLVTTSLTGSSDRPEIWNIPSLDFAQYHSYGLAQPASQLSGIVQNMMDRYQKPVLVGEYGIDSSGFHAEKDPYFRGLRQALWAGLLSGSAGTSMSWWWEELHARNLYPIYNTLARALDKTALGAGIGDAIEFVSNGDPPGIVGEQIPIAAPFTAILALNNQWGFKSSGALAVVNTEAAGSAPATLGAFFHNTAHPELKNPCNISAWFGTNGRMIMHLNSVSQGAIINVRVDGTSVFTQSVPNLDGGYAVNNEYNRDYTINLARGKHLIDIRNTGSDWFYLDWVRLENVQPSTYLGDWTPSPVAVGAKQSMESTLYVLNPAANFPVNATVSTIPALSNATIRLTNWPGGTFNAIWYDAKTFAPLGGSSATATNKMLQLSLPEFREDMVGRVIPMNRISEIQIAPPGILNLTLSNPAPVHSVLQSTKDFSNWLAEVPVPFSTQVVAVPFSGLNERQYFRIATPP
jgi:hypothetical protein